MASASRSRSAPGGGPRTLTHAAATAVARRARDYDLTGLPNEIRERVYALAHPKVARVAARAGNAAAARAVAARTAARRARSKRHGLPQGPLWRGPRQALLRSDLFPAHKNGSRWVGDLEARRVARRQKLRDRAFPHDFTAGELPCGVSHADFWHDHPKAWDGKRWLPMHEAWASQRRKPPRSGLEWSRWIVRRNPPRSSRRPAPVNALDSGSGSESGARRRRKRRR